MTPEYKTLSTAHVKTDEHKGEVEVEFATLNVIDHDSDVTLPGAFTKGEEAAISPYGHRIWDGAPPVGRGVIEVRGDKAVFKGRFFMDIPNARDSFLAVKHMSGLQEWSYGYETLERDHGEFEGKQVQFLKKLRVFEVSPVLRAAGVGTRTTSAKQHKNPNEGGPVAALWSPIKTHETLVSTKRWLPMDMTGMGIPELRAKHAAVRLDVEPDDPKAYLFDHHDATGAASMMRCVKGIAMLNGARNAPDLPDDVAKTVYDHLADHLRDGDREPPTFLKAAEGRFTFYEQAAVTLADLESLLERADEVVRLRAERQQQKFASKREAKAAQAAAASALPPVSTEMLEWIADADRRLKSLIDTPAEDLMREKLRFMREQFLRSNSPTGE